MTAVAARTRRPALWMVYPALGALVCLLYAFVPPIAGNGFVVPGVGLSCSAGSASSRPTPSCCSSRRTPTPRSRSLC